MKRRYEDRTETELFSPIRENKVKELFSKLGEVIKIPEKNEKTFDFYVRVREIRETNILIEVTSINIRPKNDENNGVETIEIDEEKFIGKIKKAIHHGEEKTYPVCDNCFRVVVIFLDTLIQSIKEYIDAIYSLPDKIDLKKYYIDAVIFVPYEGNIYDATRKQTINVKTIAYTKSKSLANLLSKIGIECVIL